MEAQVLQAVEIAFNPSSSVELKQQVCLRCQSIIAPNFFIFFLFFLLFAVYNEY